MVYTSIPNPVLFFLDTKVEFFISLCRYFYSTLKNNYYFIDTQLYKFILGNYSRETLRECKGNISKNPQ